MTHAGRWGVLSILCVFGIQQGQAQPAVCGGDYGCSSEAPTAAVTVLDAPSAAAKLANPAEPAQCPGAPVAVTAASDDERRLVCSATSQALQLLGRCGILLRRLLQVQIMSEVRHPFSRDPIFGFFDTKQDRVRITQELNIPSLVKDTPYAELPQRDFYRSLIVHEVVHGIMHQNLKGPATSHAAYEYPAYALQIASLPADVRDKFLQSIPNRARPGEHIFNDTILSFDPFFFAAHAYEHFKRSANGCAQLRALLEGEVSFIPSLPP
jgi:hypothetical protein